MKDCPVCGWVNRTQGACVRCAVTSAIEVKTAKKEKPSYAEADYYPHVPDTDRWRGLMMFGGREE